MQSEQTLYQIRVDRVLVHALEGEDLEYLEDDEEEAYA